MKYFKLFALVLFINIHCEKTASVKTTDASSAFDIKLPSVKKLKADSLYAKILYNNDNYIILSSSDFTDSLKCFSDLNNVDSKGMRKGLLK